MHMAHLHGDGLPARRVEVYIIAGLASRNTLLQKKSHDLLGNGTSSPANLGTTRVGRLEVQFADIQVTYTAQLHAQFVACPRHRDRSCRVTLFKWQVYANVDAQQLNRHEIQVYEKRKHRVTWWTKSWSPWSETTFQARNLGEQWHDAEKTKECLARCYPRGRGEELRATKLVDKASAEPIRAGPPRIDVEALNKQGQGG